MLNPNPGAPGRFCMYFSIVARASATAYSVFWDGNTFGDSPHPGLEYDTFARGAVFGLHVASRRFSAHFNALRVGEPSHRPQLGQHHPRV